MFPHSTSWACARLLLSSALLAGGFCVSASETATNVPRYFIRVLNTGHGLPHNAVTAIVQTRDGYLWVGTYDGLARFDGDSLTVFNDHPSGNAALRTGRVVSLFEDREGNLWIGHETGELTCYDNGRFVPVDVNPGWENRKFTHIGSDRNGKVWLLNEEGRLASVRGELLSVANAGTSPRVATMSRNGQGRMWVAYDGQLFSLEKDALAPFRVNGEVYPEYVTGICASSDGGLWVISAGRIRKWDGREWTEDLGATPWGEGAITMLIETRSGLLAVGTLDQGLYVLYPGGHLHFSRENGFPHDWVRCLHEDREGTLWAGTGSGGLVALHAGKVTALNPPDEWQGNVVLSVLHARDGAMWAGTEGAGLYRYFEGAWTHFGEADGLSNQFVWSVCEDAEGRLWAGTWGGGVFVHEGGRFKPVPGLEEMLEPAAALLRGSSGVMWLGTRAGLLRCKEGATRLYGRKDGLKLPDVRAVAEDRGGNVWFGMLGGGLGRLQNGTVRQYLRQDGLSSEYVQCLYVDANDVLWIGTYGGGLNRLKDGRFTVITTAQGLPNNFICHIDEDAEDNVWVSSHGGIFRASRSELNHCLDGVATNVVCLLYGKGDGMPTLECSGGMQPAGSKAPDGKLWIPTSKGVVIVDPKHAKSNQLPPPIFIERMLVDGVEVERGRGSTQPLRIAPGKQLFEFRYTALSFVAPEKMRFRYRLEGAESGWTDAGSKRTINYSRIPPGTYTFRVIASNSDGVWNEEGAALAFMVQPFVWQMLWFRVVAGMVAAALLAGAVVLVTRRRMRWKLERLERQRAVERERSRIAQDIHDNLGASLTRISLLSQSAQSELDNPSRAGTQLHRIYETTRELTRALDEIVWAVNPQHDTLDSLASYLGKFAQDFLGPLQIRCRLDVPVQLPAWPLTAEVRHNLFLAFKEALNNVVKHAGASRVQIVLSIESNAFALLLKDDGRGFVPVQTKEGVAGPADGRSGNGLKNMQQRLEKIGGSCVIRSAPGAGTDVTFRLGARPGALVPRAPDKHPAEAGTGGDHQRM